VNNTDVEAPDPSHKPKNLSFKSVECCSRIRIPLRILKGRHFRISHNPDIYSNWKIPYSIPKISWA